MAASSATPATGEWIMVTGGAGYIGSHTLVELIGAGFGCRVVDNFSNSCEESLRRVQELTGKPDMLDWVNADLRDEAAVAAAFEGRKFGGVIHFAGLKAVGKSVEEPLAYYDNNIVGTLVLLRQMRKAGCGLIIFSSSATVYGDGSEPPFAETAPVGRGVTNPYGWTKFMLEQVMIDAAKADEGLRVVLLRYFNPVGAHASGRIGEDPVGIPNNLMPYVLQVAVGRRKELTVFGEDYATADGTAERDYVHVVDLAKGHLAALSAFVGGKAPAGLEEDEAAHPRTAVFNLGTGNAISVKQVVTAMSAVLGRELPHTFGPRRAGDLARVFADTSKAERVLGWKAGLTIEDMCKDGWRWQQANPRGFRDEPAE